MRAEGFRVSAALLQGQTQTRLAWQWRPSGHNRGAKLVGVAPSSIVWLELEEAEAD